MSQIRRADLRRGDMIKGQVRPPKESEKYPALTRVVAVNGHDPEEARRRKVFRDLVPVYPDERLRLEHGEKEITARVIDLVAPIGKGQRGLIVSPPKAGKTTVLKDIAASITREQPRGLPHVPARRRAARGSHRHGAFDQRRGRFLDLRHARGQPHRGGRARHGARQAPRGEPATTWSSCSTRSRASRAPTTSRRPASGRILSGGVDSTALYPPKKFFGAARNIEGGGSLTILATALVDTGSKMDEVIFEEFKGTGNMELRLDRRLADRRIFPAIDVITSGTRKEELILDPMEAPFVWGLRRILHGVDSTERAMDMLIKGLKQTKSNQEFLTKMAKSASDKRTNNGIEL